jgi:transcriptional regulator with XRE-family HTH domain
MPRARGAKPLFYRLFLGASVVWSRRARLRAGLSQAELTARMRTSQSTIARLESGQTLPSTKTLLRYAEATDSKVHVRLSAA